MTIFSQWQQIYLASSSSSQNSLKVLEGREGGKWKRRETSEGNERIERAKAAMVVIRGPSWKLELGEIGVLGPVWNRCDVVQPSVWSVRISETGSWSGPMNVFDYEFMNYCQLTVTDKQKKPLVSMEKTTIKTKQNRVSPRMHCISRSLVMIEGWI